MRRGKKGRREFKRRVILTSRKGVTDGFTLKHEDLFSPFSISSLQLRKLSGTRGRRKKKEKRGGEGSDSSWGIPLQKRGGKEGLLTAGSSFPCPIRNYEAEYLFDGEAGGF